MPPRLSRIIAFLCIVAGSCPASEPLSLNFNLYMEGKYVYERNCIVCHGQRGDGAGEMSLQLLPKPRSFREGMFKFSCSEPSSKQTADRPAVPAPLPLPPWCSSASSGIML